MKIIYFYIFANNTDYLAFISYIMIRIIVDSFQFELVILVLRNQRLFKFFYILWLFHYFQTATLLCGVNKIIYILGSIIV